MEMSSVLEKIKEQEFYQQIQTAYQQLPTEQQNYVKWGSATAGFLILFYLIYSVIQNAGSTRTEYYEKMELTRIISDANDELRRLRGQNSGMSQTNGQNWKAILTGMITAQGLPAESLEVSKEAAQPSQTLIQETLLELKIKNAPLRSLVPILSQMERGNPPMKLKGLQIETGAEEGKLTAKINVSGYLAKPEKEGKTK